MAITKLISASYDTLDATKLTGNLPAISGASLTGLSSPKIIGHAYDFSSPDESTTSSSFADIPSNKGRVSYTTVGDNSDFIVSYGVNYKQTGNHPSYYYFFNLRYKIVKQSDSSTLVTGNSRLLAHNINEGTLITNSDAVTHVELLDPGTVAAGTALYFQPQFSSQSTGTLKLIQLNIFEVAA